MKLWAGMFLLVVGLGAAAWAFVGFVGGNALSGGLTQQVTLSDLQNYVNSGSERKYSWNQRVTLTIDTDDGPMSSYSVMKVTWEENRPRINDAAWMSRVDGEMPFVVLPDGQYVFALMSHVRRRLPERFLVPPGNMSKWVDENAIQSAVSSSSAIKIMSGDQLMPYLVTFEDISDMTSIEGFYGDYQIDVTLTSSSSINPSKVESIIPWLTSVSDFEFAPSPTAFETGNGGVFVATKKTL